MKAHTKAEHATLYHGDLNLWPSVLAPGSVVLSHIDGPYGMGKAEWDVLTGARKNRQPMTDDRAERVVGRYLEVLGEVDPQGADLVAWYAPVLESITRASAASASAYVWNTDAGEALLRPVMQALGWTFRGRVTWDKQAPPSFLGWKTVQVWPDQTEACGMYQRNAPHFGLAECIGNVWRLSTRALSLEQIKEDLKQPHRARYQSDVYASIHPCQKPLVFAERVLLASSRPGDLVVDWFGGTCRLAVANAQLAREARRQVVSFETNGAYLDAVAPALTFTPTAKGAQPSLFG